MKRCERCKKKFPIHLIYRVNLWMQSMNETVYLDAVCVLEVKREIHGVKFKKFTGTEAERLRQETIKYLGGKP